MNKKLLICDFFSLIILGLLYWAIVPVSFNIISACVFGVLSYLSFLFWRNNEDLKIIDWVCVFLFNIILSILLIFIDCPRQNLFQIDLSTCGGGFSVLITLSCILLSIFSFVGIFRSFLKKKIYHK